MCHHSPRCPSAQDSARLAARVVAAHPEQGWSLLCNGVIAFEDNGALLPDGHAIVPRPARTRPARSAA
jgi:hypothetical protein